MNKKAKFLGVLGLAIVVTWYMFNPIVRMFLLENVYIEGPVTHSGLLIVGTLWYLLIPLGFILVFLSFAFEIKERYSRTDTDEIWN